MLGAFEFERDEINNEITKTSPGNYALGYMKDNKFIVKYVGRADSDLNNRIKAHLGKGYKHFKYSYATSAKVAFEKECRNYHDFGGNVKLDNKIHPDSPSDIVRKCPVCGLD